MSDLPGSMDGGGQGPISYKVTARFDDGLYDLDEHGNWRKIGPPNPPCRCLYCMTSGRLPGPSK